MSAFHRFQGTGNTTAIVYMFLAVIGFSLIPLVVARGDGASNPFVFNAGWRFGVVLGCILILAIGYRPQLLNRQIWGVIKGRIFSWTILFTFLGSFQFALFTISARYIDISIAAVLLETWPILSILLTKKLFEGEKRFDRTSVATILLAALGFVGFLFVAASQYVNLEALIQLDGITKFTFILGIGLALSAAVAGAVESASNFRWGTAASKESLVIKGIPSKTDSLDLFFVILAFAFVSVISAPVHFVSGIVSGETVVFKALAVAIIGGGIFQAFSSVAYRVAILKTDDLGINALGYAISILSLVWLAIFFQIDVERVDFLIIGAAVIITINLLINFNAEIRLGFKALLLALGVSGTFVYLRDSIIESWGIDRWHWTAGGYFEALALSATVFTLLLAFRVARLITRTGDEDNRTFNVFRKMDILAQRGVVNEQILGCIMRIDSPKDRADLEAAYTQARNYINVARVRANSLKDVDIQFLSDAEANLDALARSKQQDITPGEMFALAIFGIITVSLALFSRPPETIGWNRLLVDIFAILISAVIVFLIVNVWDLRAERDESKLEQRKKYQNYTVRFVDTRQRSFDQWLSIIVGGAIILTYAGLLAHKWVGWFPWLG